MLEGCAWHNWQFILYVIGPHLCTTMSCNNVFTQHYVFTSHFFLSIHNFKATVEDDEEVQRRAVCIVVIAGFQSFMQEWLCVLISHSGCLIPLKLIYNAGYEHVCVCELMYDYEQRRFHNSAFLTCQNECSTNNTLYKNNITWHHVTYLMEVIK